MKLCVIYNYAQHYRTSIFKMISESFDCDFVFGDSMDDVKKLDYNLLKGNVTETHTIRFLGGWYWQKGVVSQLFRDYDKYLILGETRALSTWLFCMLARIFKYKKKVYFWSHGWYGKESFLEKVIKKSLFNLPNGGIFLYGNYARELMIKEGFNPRKLYTIHNSLAYEQQIEIRKTLEPSEVYHEHFGNYNPNLFFIGRLTPIKKLEQALDALAICNKMRNYFNFIFIGDGVELEHLKIKTDELKLSKQVWFYGSCYDEREISTLIYNADLCVAPGNIGLTAMHSLVFGTPCITHNNYPYQMPEFEAIKDGETGTFFKQDNVDDLANKIIKWFETYRNKRSDVRRACMNVIDKEWTPYYQIDVFKKVLK